MKNSVFRQSQTNQTQSNQQLQQEFWKLKSQRLQSKNQELSKENQALIKKNIDCSKRQQELIDRLAAQPAHDRSTIKGDSNDRKYDSEASREEIERLRKEIRVLKNEHSIEIIKLSEEGKNMKKRINQLEARQVSWVSGEEHSTKLNALNEEIVTLTKRLAVSQQQLQRLKEEKKKFLLDIENLNKEVLTYKSRQKAALRQQEQNMMDLRKYEKFMHEYRAEKQQLAGGKTTAQDRKQNSFEEHIFSTEQASKLKKEVEDLQKQRQGNRKLIFQLSSWEHDKTRTEIRLKQMECELADSKAELQNVLARLSPLLGHKSQLKGKENVQAKASLTLLQIFLKKYKIQAF